MTGMHPLTIHRGRTNSALAALLALTVLVASACSDAGSGQAGPSDTAASPSPSPSAAGASESPSAIPTLDPADELCAHVAELEFRLATLQAVELRLTNRTTLDVELDRLTTAYEELEGVDLGDGRDELVGPLTRLGYRIGELELAVEDFQTNTRPRRAAPHVEEDAGKVADELAAFVILSRC